MSLKTKDRNLSTFDFRLGKMSMRTNLCVHNIPTRHGRRRACREIARVLKPQGTAVISDYTAIEDYAGAFAAEGCHMEPPYRINFVPPLKVVRVRKPPTQC
jgi:SAM-dependent methyltransferase